MNNFLGSTFEIRYHRPFDAGIAPGIDVQLLAKGQTWLQHNELKFNINTKLKNASLLKEKVTDFLSFDNLKSTFETHENKLFNILENNEFMHSFMEFVWTKLTQALNKDFINDYHNLWLYKGDDIWAYGKGYYNRDANWLATKYTKPVSLNKYFDNEKITDTYNPHLKISTRLLEEINLTDFWLKNKDKFFVTLNYNSQPIYKVNNTTNDAISIDLSIDPRTKRNKTLKNHLIRINKDELLEVSSSDEKIHQYLTNISRSQKINENGTIEIFSKIVDGKEVFESEIITRKHMLYYNHDFNNSLPPDNELELPPNTPKFNDLEEKYALGAYNHNLSSILKQNEGILPNEIVGDIIDPQEIVKIDGYNIEIKKLTKFYDYGKYLERPNRFNTELYQKNVKLYTNDHEIKEAIKNISVAKPTKVVVLYDLLGNIINPGLKLSASEELHSSNDAIYDAEATILDNLFRTLIVKNDTKKLFYQEDDGKTYTLLDNESNLVYSLDWDKKIYYFATYQHAWNYLYDHIKLNAIKVVK